MAESKIITDTEREDILFQQAKLKKGKEMGEHNACRLYERHKESVSDENILGQTLRLECRIEETDVENDKDIDLLFFTAGDVGQKLQDFSTDFKKRKFKE